MAVVDRWSLFGSGRYLRLDCAGVSLGKWYFMFFARFLKGPP